MTAISFYLRNDTPSFCHVTEFITNLVHSLDCSSFTLFGWTCLWYITVCLFFQRTHFFHLLPWQRPRQRFQGFDFLGFCFCKNTLSRTDTSLTSQSAPTLKIDLSLYFKHLFYRACLRCTSIYPVLYSPKDTVCFHAAGIVMGHLTLKNTIWRVAAAYRYFFKKLKVRLVDSLVRTIGKMVRSVGQVLRKVFADAFNMHKYKKVVFRYTVNDQPAQLCG